MNKICINIIAIGIAMAFSFLITTGAYWLVTW